MIFKDISVLDEDFALLEHMDVCIEGNKISSVIRHGETEISGDAVDGRGKLIMPGLVNAHTHIPMTILRGYAECLPLDRWLNDKIFPFEDLMSPDDIYYGAMLGLCEMAASGTVSFTEMYSSCDRICEAVEISGMKANVSQGVLSFDDTPFEKQERYHISRRLFDSFHGKADGRIKIDMCIHGEYTSNSQTVRGMAEYAKKTGANMHIHLSETKKEHDECVIRHGKTPARYFEDLGVFDVPATAAHCVWLTNEDMDILAAKGVTAVHCPVSNLKLGSGVARANEMLDKGINVALGTDGAASNNSLNLWEEIKLSSILQKGYYNDPTRFPAKQSLFASTRAGFLSQGRRDSGIVKAGMSADLIVLDMDKPHMAPLYEVSDALVYSALPSDVYMTVVDGKVIYKDGELLTLDSEKVKYEVKKRSERILSEL